MLQNNFILVDFFFKNLKNLTLSGILLFAISLSAGQLIDLGSIPNFNEIFNLLTPYNVNNFTKLRLGKNNDAGYVVPKELLSIIERCYTYGAGDDISFEKDLSTFNKDIITYIYDHTTNYPSVIQENIFFKKQGIGVEAKEQLNTLKNHMLENKDQTSEILLKIDIEGAEWPVLDSLEDQILSNINIIIIEFHGFSAISNLPLYKRVLNKINDQFVPFHIHGNNCAHFLHINGKIFPDVIEVIYINKKHVKTFSKLTEKILDTDITINCPQVGNFTLDFWL